MTRELIIAGLIGALGAVCFAAGIIGYGGGDFLHPRLADREVALTVGAVGVLFLLLEARLMFPILKAMATRSASRSHSKGTTLPD